MSRQGVATTTYGYDAFGSRVFQSTGTTTALYPFKWYSVASSTGTGAKYATTTEYVFNGDSLVSTIDQQTASGAATGTAQTSFIHPDRLGSTNVVTNASGTVVQTLDYYPYGATRVSTSVGGADSARKYIGQFADASNLDYLQARYYEGSRGCSGRSLSRSRRLDSAGTDSHRYRSDPRRKRTKSSTDSARVSAGVPRVNRTGL